MEALFIKIVSLIPYHVFWHTKPEMKSPKTLSAGLFGDLVLAEYA